MGNKVRPNSGLESTIFGGSTLMPTKVRMDGWTYRRLDRKYSVSSEELHLIKVEMKKKVRRQVNRSLKKIWFLQILYKEFYIKKKNNTKKFYLSHSKFPLSDSMPLHNSISFFSWPPYTFLCCLTHSDLLRISCSCVENKAKYYILRYAGILSMRSVRINWRIGGVISYLLPFFLVSKLSKFKFCEPL